MASAIAMTIGNQYFWSASPAEKSCGINRGNGFGSVPHHRPAACCTMVARASVESSHKCSSLRASTRRIAIQSVISPKAAPAPIEPNKASAIGQPSVEMNQAPKIPPSIEIWPVVTDKTFDVEYMTLYVSAAAAYKAPVARPVISATSIERYRSGFVKETHGRGELRAGRGAYERSILSRAFLGPAPVSCPVFARTCANAARPGTTHP